MTDIRVLDMGSYWALVPVSPLGIKWITESVSADPWQWHGSTLAVDGPSARELVTEARSVGLTVEVQS